jgi:hypothetical protein
MLSTESLLSIAPLNPYSKNQSIRNLRRANIDGIFYLPSTMRVLKGMHYDKLRITIEGDGKIFLITIGQMRHKACGRFAISKQVAPKFMSQAFPANYNDK